MTGAYPVHTYLLMILSEVERGGRFMTSGSTGSTPKLSKTHADDIVSKLSQGSHQTKTPQLRKRLVNSDKD